MENQYKHIAEGTDDSSPPDAKMNDTLPPYNINKQPLHAEYSLTTGQRSIDIQPHITRSPGPHIRDYSDKSVKEYAKAICFIAFCWFWIPFIHCIGCCFNMCRKSNSNANPSVR